MACVFDPVIKYVCSNFISSVDSKCNAQRNHGKTFDSNVQLGWDGMAYVFDHSKCNAHGQTTGSIRFAIGSHARDKCSHGVVADGPGRESFNLRFGLHTKGTSEWSAYQCVDRHWPVLSSSKSSKS
eukprot:FR737468.1.p2 GENE.FR737468.1~~FR737468.1.p2  ORF type:complete len:126 (+),score=10.28 FR737468.1:391-768(+)